MLNEHDINDYKDDGAPQPSPKAPIDVVNHPPHYLKHPSGVECIQITEHMGFTLGNAMKYPVSYTHLTLPTNREV